MSSEIVKNRNDFETLESFLSAWKVEDWNTMSSLCQITWLVNESNPIGSLQLLFENHQLKGFSTIGLVTRNSVSSNIKLMVSIGNTKQIIVVIVIKESKEYTPSEDGSWGVNPLSILRGLMK